MCASREATKLHRKQSKMETILSASKAQSELSYNSVGKYIKLQLIIRVLLISR